MQCVFVYGPPASGKLTISQALAEASGFRLFHNHLTVPAAKAIFPCTGPDFDPRYIELVSTFRIMGITAAADADVDLIFTVAYSGTVDDPFVDEVVKVVESRRGRMLFVELSAPEEVLMARVGNESRHRAGKMTTPERLRLMLDARDHRASVKHPNILRLDTSRLSPAEAVASILHVARQQ